MAGVGRSRNFAKVTTAQSCHSREAQSVIAPTQSWPLNGEAVPPLPTFIFVASMFDASV